MYQTLDLNNETECIADVALNRVDCQSKGTKNPSFDDLIENRLAHYAMKNDTKPFNIDRELVQRDWVSDQIHNGRAMQEIIPNVQPVVNMGRTLIPNVQPMVNMGTIIPRDSQDYNKFPWFIFWIPAGTGIIMFIILVLVLILVFRRN